MLRPEVHQPEFSPQGRRFKELHGSTLAIILSLLLFLGIICFSNVENPGCHKQLAFGDGFKSTQKHGDFGGSWHWLYHMTFINRGWLPGHSWSWGGPWIADIIKKDMYCINIARNTSVIQSNIARKSTSSSLMLFLATWNNLKLSCIEENSKKNPMIFPMKTNISGRCSHDVPIFRWF